MGYSLISHEVFVLQVFIGHSEPIFQLLATPDGRRVISAGDAIFFWDFLAPSPLPASLPAPSTSSTLTHPHHTSLFSVSPRVGPPAPTNYEPLKNHMFTPLPTEKNVRIIRGSNDDDRHLYFNQSDSSEGGEGERGRRRGREGGGEECAVGEEEGSVTCAGRDVVIEDSSGDSETESTGSSNREMNGGQEKETGNGDIVIEHVSQLLCR